MSLVHIISLPLARTDSYIYDNTLKVCIKITAYVIILNSYLHNINKKYWPTLNSYHKTMEFNGKPKRRRKLA